MANKTPRKREAQLNPTTRLVDKVITMKLPVSYQSTILHEYLTYSQGTMLAMFERLGGLLRMLSKDSRLTESVQLWQKLNLQICEKQLSDITKRREVLVLGMDIELPEINTPEAYKVDFIASHPIAHQMVKLIKAVNVELRENEALYMAGIVDDTDYESIKAQAVTVLSGVIDRIAKATYPGKREGGGYNPAQLAKYIRDGNKLEFADVPLNVRSVIADYELSGVSPTLAGTGEVAKAEKVVAKTQTKKPKAKAKVDADKKVEADAPSQPSSVKAAEKKEGEAA